MANMYDYLRWRGDITCAERPFNDVDNVILSTLSYLDFGGIVPDERDGGSMPLGMACEALHAKAGDDLAPFVRSIARIDVRFVELLARSERFATARVSAYADEIDQERALQFAALQVDFDDGLTYVSFRGTDSSLVGWREDFMLSFTITESQREAARYLARAVERASAAGRRVYVGGHSKGGNLAEYAARCLPDELSAHVRRVYSNDGPGLASEVMPTSGQAHLGSTLRRIVPSYSVVGMLFTRMDKPRRIVASTGIGIGQHDPTTWKVEPAGLELVPELQRDCIAMNRTIDKWLRGIPLDERRRTVDDVFGVLEAGGATQLNQLLSAPDRLPKMLSAFGKTVRRAHGDPAQR